MLKLAQIDLFGLVYGSIGQGQIARLVGAIKTNKQCLLQLVLSQPGKHF